MEINIMPQVVHYWILHPIIEKRKRRTKLIGKQKNIITNWAKSKPINLVSARRIQRRFNSLSKKKKFNCLKKVSLSTVNRTVGKHLSKPKQIKKVFFLSSTNKDQRIKFLRLMKKMK